MFGVRCLLSSCRRYRIEVSDANQLCPFLRKGSRNLRIAGAAIAPTCRVTSWPSLNNAIVGIALIRKRRARFCAFSVFTFATSHFPAPSRATLLSSGATILHGPHQGAQKSTSTGSADCVVKASKARSLATSIGSPGALSSVPHFPQRPVPPSLSYFKRLRWPHFGQVINTPRSSSCVEFI
jgi:hypothetical protein